MSNSCPICDAELQSAYTPAQNFAERLDCPGCGSHPLTYEAFHAVRSIANDAEKRRRLAHGVYKMPRTEVITLGVVQAFVATVVLPGPMERLDNLIRYLAEHFAPGVRQALHAPVLAAKVGSGSLDETKWVLEESHRLGWVTGNTSRLDGVGTIGDARLTVDGWKHFEALMRNGAGSRHAFMAMKFDDQELDALFNTRLVPAVKQTGFALRTTTGKHQTAGSIDDRMRVEIRTSRFVVCDLTHSNRGAYWEAGFAEGLGRPVFYICRADILANKGHDDHPHFDTAHQLILAWDPSDLEEGMERLKAAIRATLPDEAALEDE